MLKLTTNALDSYLNDLGIKITHSQKDFLNLEDIFVYPDLRHLDDDSAIKSKYKTPLNVIEKYDYAYFLGSEKSGKTTLLKKLAKEKLADDFNVIIFNADEINDISPLNLVSKFDKKYNTISNPNKEYILFIDDFSKLKISEKYIDDFFSKNESFFKKIYLFIDKRHFFGQRNKHLNKKYEIFEILNFGYSKRNEIYQKWYNVGVDSVFTINDNELLKKIDTLAGHFDTLMKKNIMESKPIYILTIIQTLENMSTTRDFSLTSYGHCYNTLIMGMLGKAGVSPNNDLDGVINFISYLSYYFFQNNLTLINEATYQEIINKYSEKYIPPNNLKTILIDSNILYRNNDDAFLFPQKYIYYFCCAKFISDNASNMSKTIDSLCTNLHNENNANILIFLVHHLRSPELLENIITHTMCILDKTIAYDMTKISNEDFHEKFKFFLKDEVKKLVLKEKDVYEERKKILSKKDELSEKATNEDNPLKTVQEGTILEDKKLEDNFLDDDIGILQDASSAFRSIEVLGQISKNRYASMDKKDLYDIIHTAYEIGLKTLTVYMDIFIKSEGELKSFIKSVVEEKQRISEDEALKIAEKIIFQVCYSLCVYMIQFISKSTAHTKLLDISEEITQKSNNEAFRLIDMYSRLTISKRLPRAKIKSIYIENRHNDLVEILLKDMVLNHLYLHKVEYDDKDWIQQTLSIKLENQLRATTNKVLKQIK